jgi:hypothetical protein
MAWRTGSGPRQTASPLLQHPYYPHLTARRQCRKLKLETKAERRFPRRNGRSHNERFGLSRHLLARVAELADALDLGSSGATRAGSIPVSRNLNR